MIKKVTQSISGLFFSTLVTFLLFPLVANLYGPEAIGNYGHLVALSSLLVIICTFRLEMCIPQNTNIEEAHQIVIFVVFASIVLLSGVILFFDVSLNLVLITFFQAQYLIASALLIREEKIKRLAFFRILRSWGNVIFPLILFYFIEDNGLVISYIGVLILITLIAYKNTTLKYSSLNILSIVKPNIELIRSNRQFFLYNTPQAFLMILLGYLPIFILSEQNSSYLLGLVILVDRIVGTPFNLLNQALREMMLKYHISNLIIKYTVISLLVFPPLYYIIHPLFDFLISKLLLVMSTEWQESAKFFYYLIAYYGSLLLISPCSVLLIKYKKQHLFFIYSLALFIIVCAIGTIFWKAIELNEMILFYYSGIAVCNILFGLFIILKFTPKHLQYE